MRAQNAGLVAGLALPNTLALPAVAEQGMRVTTVEQLQTLLVEQPPAAPSLLVLGSGSNIVLPQVRSGVTVLLRIKGINEVAGNHAERTFEVGGGESWQGFVRFCVGQGLGGGIENLSLIPGTVGAAPIQNIGAYGVEVAEFVRAVQVLDTKKPAAEPRWMPVEDCEFGYRDSCFKRAPGRWLVTAVRFGLASSVTNAFRLDYAGLTDELERMGQPRLSVAVVAEAVCRTRRAKLPDPRRYPNAGSFFKNPVLASAAYEQLFVGLAPDLKQQLRAIPVWQQGAEIKLAAAALIERCGFKQKPAEQVQVWFRQPLVLVNRGAADATAVLAYADAIKRAVAGQFGVILEQEPVALQ